MSSWLPNRKTGHTLFAGSHHPTVPIDAQKGRGRADREGHRGQLPRRADRLDYGGIDGIGIYGVFRLRPAAGDRRSVKGGTGTRRREQLGYDSDQP